MEERFERRLRVLARLLAPNPSSARTILDQAIGAVSEGPSIPAGETDLVWRRLVERVLGQLRPDSRPDQLALGRLSRWPDVPALRDAINAVGPSAPPFSAGPSDSALLVLVRALPLTHRRALTLTTLYRAPRAAGWLLGLDEPQLAQLQLEAVRKLHGMLAGYAERQLDGTGLSAKCVPRLRPLPVGADGVAVIRGSRVYIDADYPSGLIGALLKLLARMQDRIRHTLHLPDPGDDDVGETYRHKPLDPTPTTQPIRKPAPTPSLQPHRMPGPTTGTAVHNSPRGTPSTQRLSSRSRPLAATPTSYSWLRR